MILKKVFENKLIGFFSSRRNKKTLLIFYFLLLFFTAEISKAGTNIPNSKNNQIEIEYLDSKNELEDYIIDTGDSIYLEFFPADELSGLFPVNEEGEILLPRLYETFVRGLTKSELKVLLEKRYSEFLINPEIKVRIVGFKDLRVLARGELRKPGFYKFPAYESNVFMTVKRDDSQIDEFTKNNEQSSQDLMVKRSSEKLITISDVIRTAGGITSRTDLSRIEIIRDVPLGKGGGKKKAIIDFTSYLNESDVTNDIRIFDGDSLFFHKLSKKDPNQIPKSILAGISPPFISVNLFGRIENAGEVRLPLEAALSDAIDISGPVKPLSGKIVLLRYEQDGSITKKKISYSAKAKRGSKRNPFLKANDLISVKQSAFGKSTSVLKEVSDPFVGIYSTILLFEKFSGKL